MALEQEAWEGDIAKNLYANNQFMQMVGKDDSKYVNYRTVHLPQSGAKPTVVKDRTILPAPINLRADTESTYNLAWYSTDVVALPSGDTNFLSYDKRMDVMGDHIKTLGDVVANQTLYAWAPATTTSSTVVQTSGTSTAGALAPGATGSRNLMSNADLRKANRILDSQNLGVGERYLIIPSDMYWLDLLAISEFTKYLEFGKSVLPTGVIGNIFGMNVILRSSVVVYDTSGNIKTVGGDGTPSTTATTDNYGALVVHGNYVRKALGSITAHIQEDAPEYYGPIISADVFHGAAKSRTNGEGIVAIRQA